MNKKMAALAALLMAVGIVMGAFGAHMLKEKLDTTALSSYQTGVLYLIYNALGLLVLSVSWDKGGKLLKWGSKSIVLGSIFFSGSLFLLSASTLLGVEAWKSLLGPITPLGGLLLIFGWLFVATGFILHRKL